MARRTLMFLVLVSCLGMATFATTAGLAQAPTQNDNDKVIALSQKGLDDDIIIAKIKASDWKFQLGDDDLIALKKAGVSSKVVAAMLDASVLTTAQVSVNGKNLEMHTLGQAKVGGRIGNALTYGVKSVKQKAFLNGRTAPATTGASPQITIALPKGETIDNYIVVQMDQKGDRRELEVGSAGGLVGAKTGIRAEAIQKTTAEPVGPNTYKLVLDASLKPGAYIVYVVGSADRVKEIYGRGYDFDVE